MPRKKKNGLLESLESLKKLKARNDKTFGRLTAISNSINNGFENPIYDLIDTLKRQTALWNTICEQQKTISTIAQKMEALNNVENIIAQPMQQIHAFNNIVNTIAPPTFISTIEKLENIYGNAKSHLETMEFLDELKELEPYFELELKKTEYQNKTIAEIYEMSIDPKNKKIKPGSLFARLLKDARLLAKSISVHGINLTTHTMPNNALMNTLQQRSVINAGAFDMVVSNARGKRKEITAYTMIELDPEKNSIELMDTKLTEYERQVSDAIISLWIEANKEKVPPIFTIDIIFRAMPGGSDKPSPQQKTAITQAIEKFRRLHITVDATDEMRKRGIIASNETFKLDNVYLSATHAEYKIKNGRQIVDAYKIDSEPIILTYCKMTKQLLTVSAKYLAIEKVKNGRASRELLPITKNRQAMVGYLLRRITIMEYDKKNKIQKQRNIILFDTLFTETGTRTTNRKQTMNDRNFCFKILDFWKISGLISGYSKQKKGCSITGIVIDL